MTQSSLHAPEGLKNLSMAFRPARVWEYVDERIGLSAMVELARHKTVPRHAHSFWYYLGGIALFLFGVQVVTGVLLMIYYRPGPEAYDSVRQITHEVDFGWLIRSAHAWSANLMVLAVFVHMFSVFFMRAYRKPREFGWWSGLGLLGLVMVFGFSGYLLPMDELSYFATKVGLEVSGAAPGVGPVAADMIRGGSDVNENTTQRFFTLHVFVLPAAFVLVLAFHLYLVQRHGNAVPPKEEAKPNSERRSVPFFPNFFIRDLGMWLIVVNVLVLLVAVFPAELGPQADPIAPAPLGIHPEWYFMSQFQLLKVLGSWLPGTIGEIVGIMIFTAGGIIWGLIPLFDLREAGPRLARATTWVGIGALVGLIGLTVWGYAALP